MVKKMYFTALICCLILSSTGTAFAAKGTANEELLRARELGKSVNAFAFDLYKEIAKEEKGNIFFSPLSISMALALAYEGAAGETREEMRRVLHFKGNAGEQFRAYLDILNDTPKESGELLLATAVWPDVDLNISERYVDILKKYYNCDVTIFDFSGSWHITQAMNNWISGKTKGKIKHMVTAKDIEKECLMLGSAIYFNGGWEEKFNSKKTKGMPFFHTAKEVEEMLFMYQKGNIDYFENVKLQSVRFNFKNGVFSYIVLLPRKQNDWMNIRLSQELFDEVLRGMKPSNVTIYLPKFKMESSYTLNATLQNIGIKKAFKEYEADFSNISLTNAMPGKDTILYYLSKIMHKAIFEINEDHVKAAAATSVSMEGLKILNKYIEFKADRPYVYIITDKRTGLILFIGKKV